MAYKYAKQSKAVAKEIMNGIGLLTNAVPDQQELPQAIASAAAIYAQVSAIMSAENEDGRAKFGLKVGLALGNMLTDKYIEDEE